jgi:hypothetical protein
MQREPSLRLGVEHGQEEVVLPLEVRVHRPGRVPGLFRDLVQRRPVKPPPQEHPQCGLEQLRAGLLLPLGPGEPDRQWDNSII